jgi:4-diphosphocytidyl-2-C-methyl-D-erythritol kinase
LTVRLHVTGVRPDGYHLIDAEMVALDLADELHFAPGSGVELVDRTGRGLDPPAPDDDLVTRALRLVGRAAHVTVHKHIPLGAGLGGGSADAAAVLRWAGRLDPGSAARLGADVPFCLAGGARARVRGIGEVLDPLPPIERTFTLLTPPFGCSTPAVYRAWDELGGPRHPTNDLEPAALVVEPRLARWRDELEEATGRRPTLAGSGSTWFVDGAHPGPGRVVARALTSA